jgi:hypothetical protein
MAILAILAMPVSRNCEDIVRLLVEFLEHQLPPDVHADLERH